MKIIKSMKEIIRKILIWVSPVYRKLNFLEKKIDNKLLELEKKIHKNLNDIENKVSSIESKTSGIENKVSSIEKFKNSISELINQTQHNDKSIKTALALHPEAINEINSDSICIDCGGHIGLISEIFLRLGSRVYTFEPNIYLINYMKYRLHEYVAANKLILINKAVWDRNENIKLYFRENYSKNNITHIDSESSSILVEKTNKAYPFYTDDSNYIEVESVDIVDFIIKLNQKVHILKIDIEGVEFDVLNKIIDKEVYKKINYIFVETHDHKIPELKPIADIVRRKIQENNILNIFLDWR